ncbi:Os05g0484700 [Oryza sativa Japonica Group]|uniref:Os05g0484700 protein n=1 Tax=Oryza sativa subsp. japonica TaxID=39947 RepID=A0A0P0WNU6_ORYSJ|nr:Os05g0484700 [Oryza sativa Japonica Group]
MAETSLLATWWSPAAISSWWSGAFLLLLPRRRGSGTRPCTAGRSWSRWVSGCCSSREAAPDRTTRVTIRATSSARASTSWMTGGSTASRQCSLLAPSRGNTPAETPASGYRRRMRRGFRVWTSSCRSKARRTTHRRRGFSPEIAHVSFDRPGTGMIRY